MDGVGKDTSGFAAAAGASERGDRSDRGPPLVAGGSSQSKRLNHAGSKGSTALSQDYYEIGPSRTSSRAGVKGGIDGNGFGGPEFGADETVFSGAGLDENSSSASSRLPLLPISSARPGPGGVASRPSDGGFSEAPRLRFSATMLQPPSRGSPS